jgi:hypothetical protein
MYCDQALFPFITSAAECSAFSAAVWAPATTRYNPAEAIRIGQTLCQAYPLACIAGSAIITGAWLGEQIIKIIEASRADKPIGRPKNGLPTGTKPLDQSDVPREAHGKVKKGAGIGNADWSGVDEDGNLWSGSPSGDAVNHGPWRDYIP